MSVSTCPADGMWHEMQNWSRTCRKCGMSQRDILVVEHTCKLAEKTSRRRPIRTPEEAAFVDMFYLSPEIPKLKDEQ